MPVWAEPALGMAEGLCCQHPSTSEESEPLALPEEGRTSQFHDLGTLDSGAFSLGLLLPEQRSVLQIRPHAVDSLTELFMHSVYVFLLPFVVRLQGQVLQGCKDV